LDRLEAVDRLAELAALPRVGGGVVGGSLRDPERLRTRAQPGDVKRGHRDLEAVSDLADDVLLRDPYAIEDRLTGRRAADPELLLQLADAESGSICLHHERRDAT